MHMCMCIYMYVYVCMYVYMCIEKNEIRERFAKEHDGNPKYLELSQKGPPRKQRTRMSPALERQSRTGR